MNFAQGKMVCEIFAYLWFSKTESMVLKLAQKTNSHRVRTRFAFLWNSHKVRIPVKFTQGSHSCEIRTRFAFLWNSHKVRIPVKFAQRTESMQFLKSGAKANSNRVSGVRILLSLVFSPLFSLVFTKTSFFKPSYLHVNTKNRNQTTLEWN